jgi:hypothetical protein
MSQLTTLEIVGDKVHLVKGGELVAALDFGTVAMMSEIVREHLLRVMPVEVPCAACGDGPCRVPE